MGFVKSLRFKFIAGFSLVILPLVLFLYYNNVYANKVVRDQVSLINANHLSKNVEQNESVLHETNRYLYNLGNSDPDIISLYFLPFGSGDYTVAKQRILNKFTTDTGFYNLIDSFFLYNLQEDDLLIGSPDHYNDKVTAIRELMPDLQIEPGQIQTPHWRIVHTPSQNGLVKMVRINQNLIAGAWVNMNSLNNPEQFLDMGEKGGAIIVGADGEPLSDTSLSPDQIKLVAQHLDKLDSPYESIIDPQDKQKYLMVGMTSKLADIHYIVLLPEEKILLNLPFFQRVIKWIPVVALGLLMIILFFLNSVLFKPMGTLIKGMRRATRGDLEFRLESGYSLEFKFLIETFNQMISQIQHLKIDIYEEQLRTREAEFKQLQMQINPHFYLNSLNIIYSLAGLKKTELVQQMAEHLADYFRFSIRSDRDYIYLHEEIEHIEHYLEIQKLRFPGKLTFDMKLDESLKTSLLPPLTVQPFVENAIIHGFKNRKRMFQIEVGAMPDEQYPDKFMNIWIRDNGAGFPAVLLEQLQSGEYSDDHWKQHLGIWNVEHRLRMKYGDDVALSFKNHIEGGAVVMIRMPIQWDESLGGVLYA